MSLTTPTKIAFATAVNDPTATSEIIAILETGIAAGGSSVVTSVAGRTGDVALGKVDVGLNLVDNTADISKPISSATQTALDLKQPVDPTLTALAALITSSDKMIYTAGPDVFLTTDLSPFARTLLDDLSATASRTTLGLGLVENTALSTTLAAWTGSTNLITLGTITTGTWSGTAIGVSHLGTGTPSAGTYLDGAGSWTDLPLGGDGSVTTVALTAPGTLFAVGGSPVTTTGTLALTFLTKAANTVLAGPTTGSAAAPTMRTLVAADIPDISGSYATLANLATKADDSAVVHNTGNETIAGVKTFTSTISGSIDGNANTATTVTNGVVTTGSYSNPAWITALAGSKITGNITGNAAGLTANIAESQVTNLVSDLALNAPLASPTFTGTPLAPTAADGTNTTQIATTEFVQTAVGGLAGTVVSVFGRSGTVTATSGDYLVSQVTGAAPLASPSFTGTVTVGTLTGLLKGSTGVISAASAGTDYLAPGGSGSALTGITESQVTGLVSDLAAKATDSSVVHVTGNESIAGTKTFTSTISASINGNANTVTNGVVTTGSYADPNWITSLAGSKITGNIPGNAAGLSANITESQVTNLVSDLALKATLASPSFTGTVTVGSLSGLVKATSGALSAASAGTDYLSPSGNGSALTGITESQVTSLISDLAAKAPLVSPNLTGTPTFGGSTSGTTGLKASAVASGTLTLPAGTDTLATQTYVTSQGYVTGNQTITLSGDVSGSGTTAITTVVGVAKITNTMLAGSITAAKLVGSDITITESQVTSLTTDLAAKAPLASPSFTGTVTVGTLTGLIKGATGALSAATEGTDYLSGASNKLPVHLAFTGTGIPAVATDVNAWSYIDLAATVFRLTLTCKTAPTGNFQVTIKRSTDSGSTFPDTIATVTIGSGAKLATTTTIANAALAAADILRCDIISVNGAADWTAKLSILSRNQ